MKRPDEGFRIPRGVLGLSPFGALEMVVTKSPAWAELLQPLQHLNAQDPTTKQSSLSSAPGAGELSTRSSPLWRLYKLLWGEGIFYLLPITIMESLERSAALATEEASFGLKGDPRGGPCLVIILRDSILLFNSFGGHCSSDHLCLPSLQWLMAQPMTISV